MNVVYCCLQVFTAPQVILSVCYFLWRHCCLKVCEMPSGIRAQPSMFHTQALNCAGTRFPTPNSHFIAKVAMKTTPVMEMSFSIAMAILAETLRIGEER